MIIQTVRRNAHIGFWALLIAIAALGVTASAQSRRNGVGVTVYTNPNYSGQSASFRDDTPTLLPYALNDKVSSIEIPNGETWEVCQDVNYGNRCQTLTASVPNLSSIGWNDRISSLRRINNGGFRDRRPDGALSPGTQQGLVFYDRPGFRGDSSFVVGVSPNVPARQGSVQLRGGGTWELCDRSGRCATVTQDVSNLSQLGLNGRITSARLLNNSYGNGRGRR
jgi:Beta/Gamma crystallin